MPDSYDIIVVGGGHAGAEAAWAAARLGLSTALVTMDRAAIGRMSCNPAMGGIAKGQMIREIDALGGLMGLATDAGGIQFRILNRRKGPAVQAPRAQCDRRLYAQAVQNLLASTPNLTIIEGLVEDLETSPGTHPVASAPCGRRETGITASVASAPQLASPSAGGRRTQLEASLPDVRRPPGDDATDSPVPPPRAVTAVRLADGRVIRCRAVVLTTGTFLRGLLHQGDRQFEGGRLGEPGAAGLSACLARLGLQLGRLKTGTPPRVARDSVDYARLEEQPPDDDPRPFSFLNDRIAQPQVSCWITYTNERTHDLIRANLHRAPMYTGQISSTGPRYCPSIETKIVRFADKSRHQVFLEPEGYDSDRLYCNGISTSLPTDVQDEMVRSIPGLERAVILQHGYAVEYDYVPPQQTRATLECKHIAGLFLAGQINGTSGYEEAAGQGLVAGINAARRVLGRESLVLGREQAYIGVMIDDLVTRGTIEPYRMFTSRAEYRLILRSDNADARLTPIGREVGLVDEARWQRFTRKQEAMRAFAAWAERTGHAGRRLVDWLRSPDEEIPPGVDWTAWHIDLRSCRPPCRPWEGEAPAEPRDAEPCAPVASAPRGRRKTGTTPPAVSPPPPGASIPLALYGLGASRVSQGSRTSLDGIPFPCPSPAQSPPVHAPLLAEAMAAARIEARYGGYVIRQQREVERFRKLETVRIPDDFDFTSLRQLRLEAREKLAAVAPRSIGQARRVDGISPADIAVIMLYLEGTRRRGMG